MTLTKEDKEYIALYAKELMREMLEEFHDSIKKEIKEGMYQACLEQYRVMTTMIEEHQKNCRNVGNLKYISIGLLIGISIAAGVKIVEIARWLL